MSKKIVLPDDQPATLQPKLGVQAADVEDVVVVACTMEVNGIVVNVDVAKRPGVDICSVEEGVAAATFPINVAM